jgi:Uma2 family endonuclease
MSTATLLTVEQFEQLPEEDGVQYELKDGQLVRLGEAKFGHAKFGDERTKFRIARSLMAYILAHPIGEVYSETAFELSPSRVCAPDVAFLSNESVAKGDPEHIYRGAPDLAIEVVSETENALELRQKIQDYLDAGSKAVWAFYPRLRVIAVYDQSGVSEFRGDRVLEAPEILPGFQARVNQFFE